MKKMRSGFKSFLCNIKTLIYARLGELLSFAKKVLLFLTKAPLTFAKKVLLFLTKAPLDFAKKILLFLTKAPLTFAKKVLFFRRAWLFCVKKYVYILFCLAVAMAVFGSSFLSCSPEFADQGSGNTNTTSNNNNDDGDDDDDPDETCDDNEGDPCKGNETCERVCEAIFEEYGEIRACINTGDETVDKLQKVHNLLMGKNAGVTSGTRTEVTRSPAEVEDDLNKIGEDEDEDGGVDRDAFRCYLEIGASKYITQIKKGLAPSGVSDKRERLIKTLEWMVKDKESAEILADVNAGDDILEILLFSLGDTYPPATPSTHCIGGSDYSETHLVTSVGANMDQKIWGLDISNNNLIIKYYKSGSLKGTISLDSTHDAKLYNALSCMHEGDSGPQNIFSYSAEKENQYIFNLAFELLSDICENVTEKSREQDKACARTLMCWTAWQNTCDSSAKGKGMDNTPCESPRISSHSTNNKLWNDMLDEHESALEKSGGTNYNDCKAVNFGEFF